MSAYMTRMTLCKQVRVAKLRKKKKKMDEIK